MNFPGEDAGDVIQVIEEKPKKYYRAKFFKFSENQRPPYYGTWRKKSKLLGPRKPFAQDSVIKMKISKKKFQLKNKKKSFADILQLRNRFR